MCYNQDEHKMPTENKIFISYSHKDKVWLERLNTHLKPLIRTADFDIWDDTKINVGVEWKEEISKALSTSKIAVLLVSPHFLASDFIYENELSIILNAVEKDELKLFWVLVSKCLYDQTRLVNFQPANNLKKPLESLPKYKQDEVLNDICKKIKNAYSTENYFSNNQVELIALQEQPIEEVVPDDWFDSEGSLFGRIKRFFKF